ncbi:hypothetical protein MSAN_00113800 [Mycena sanguinolenta]|uniref:Uncharacterized protein n=1 Tax=Mycena sanguinolenta TaxID=230812 RepID=A0A8H7DJY2_9AGAR|nr:hypothetical protein MSAN_00113800 [Mycena sanguinolenta]
MHNTDLRMGLWDASDTDSGTPACSPPSFQLLVHAALSYSSVSSSDVLEGSSAGGALPSVDVCTLRAELKCGGLGRMSVDWTYFRAFDSGMWMRIWSRWCMWWNRARGVRAGRTASLSLSCVCVLGLGNEYRRVSQVVCRDPGCMGESAGGTLRAFQGGASGAALHRHGVVGDADEMRLGISIVIGNRESA